MYNTFNQNTMENLPHNCIISFHLVHKLLLCCITLLSFFSIIWQIQSNWSKLKYYVKNCNDDLQ